MKKISLFIGVFLWGLVASFALIATPLFSQSAQAACDKRFLTMPVWYRGLGPGCDANIEAIPGEHKNIGGKLGAAILIVGLNIVEMLMHIASYTAAAFIIVGGFKYMTSMGSPDGNVKGRKTIMNAVIGLIVSMVAITVVSYLVKTMTS